ncbi:MAG TPA: long-chain fatty acid--CoA ligase [Terriglobales bacterium]|nr:long-chain fatty acid--CoA ligase [Terriglobales bacterium]
MATRAHWVDPGSPGLRTLNDLLLWMRQPQVEVRRLAKRDGRWQGPDSRTFYRQVRAVEAALRHRLGARPGDRIAILAESSPEWLIADFACLAAGLIDVPIYPTLTAEQVAYILRDSGAVGVFVSNSEQAEKVRQAGSGLAGLQWICSFVDPEWAELLTREPADDDDAFDQRLQATRPEEVATIIYTSGTTGNPKGVMLTHAQLAANLNVTTRDFEFGRHERRLSILPLSHITERHIAYVDLLHGGDCYFAESLDKVAENLIEVRPTLLVSVPRLFEKIVAAVQAQAAKKPAAARRIFQWAVAVGKKMAPYRLESRRAPWGLRARVALADALVGRKLRAKMGGKLDKIISGGAALSPEVAAFLVALGVVVDEGYGLTETAPVIAINRPGARRPKSVGKPMPNLEVRIAADGEILVRGPSVFSGYFQQPEATAAALVEGWFHTGDIGRLDDDGFLYITDRKRDLIKTSGGKFIAPQPIENRLKNSPLVAEAVVVGEGRKYAVALLTPHWPALEAQGIECGDRAAACADARVQALFVAEVERVNAGLARFETLKKFALLEAEFTVASGELTPTVKVRRRAVEANYRAVIDSMYE